MSAFQVGDVVLTGAKSQGIVSLAIKLGQRLRGYTPAERRFSHAALIIGTDGTIAEAEAKGVVKSHISKYQDGDYVVIRTQVDAHDRKQILTYVDAVLRERTRYGFVTFAGLALYCLFGGQLCIQQAGTAICSGLVCDALTRAGHVWPRPPYSMMPAGIARHFSVGGDVRGAPR